MWSIVIPKCDFYLYIVLWNRMTKSSRLMKISHTWFYLTNTDGGIIRMEKCQDKYAKV